MGNEPRTSLLEMNAKIEAYKDALKQLELVNKMKKLPIWAIIDLENKIKKLEREIDGRLTDSPSKKRH